MTESLASIVRQVAQANPDLADPKDLTPLVLEQIAGREEDALRRLLPSYVGSVLRRRGPASEDEVEAWEAFLEERVSTQHGTVFVRDATAEDFDQGAVRRRTFAGSLDRRAIQFAETAVQMRQANADYARDLTVAQGVETLRSMRAQVAALQSTRLSDTRRVKTLAALRTAKATLESLVEAGRNPSIDTLTGYRDSLIARREQLLDAMSKGVETDDWLESLSG